MNQKIKNPLPAKKILLLLILVFGFYFSFSQKKIALAEITTLDPIVVTGKNYCDQEQNMMCLGDKCSGEWSNLVSDEKAQKECQENNGEDGIEKYFCCQKTTSNSDSCPSPKEGITSGFLVFHGSIVPCGRSCNDEKTKNWDETKSCTLCHFFIIFKQVYDLFFSLIIVVAILLLTAGGVIYVVSAGRPGMKTLAKNIISKALIGFALFLLSWLLVYTILKFISANSPFLEGGEKWNDFTCDTESVFDKKK